MVKEEFKPLKDKPPCEVYTLILKHDIWDGEEFHEFEEPVVVRGITEFGHCGSQRSYYLHEMLDKLTHEVISKTCGGVD